MSEAQAPVLTSTSLEVSNLDHFVQVLSAWHTKQVQTINHYLTIPVGQAVEVGGEGVLSIHPVSTHPPAVSAMADASARKYEQSGTHSPGAPSTHSLMCRMRRSWRMAGWGGISRAG